MLERKKGKYIVAVSGGVDSMALLDMLVKSKTNLVVVHIDHGIRLDGQEDKKVVEDYCRDNSIKFIFKELNLGTASEAVARDARYKTLRECLINENADAIVTAHHQDDMIETAIINLLRGTGWRGLAPFVSENNIVRPLLGYTKKQILEYAKENHLTWRDDPTNKDQKYLRNYVRQNLLPKLQKMDKGFYDSLLGLILKQRNLRREIETELGGWSELNRYQAIMLPRNIAYEIMQNILVNKTGSTFESSLVKDALLFVKVASPSKTMQLNKDWQFSVTKRDLIIESRTSK